MPSTQPTCPDCGASRASLIETATAQRPALLASLALAVVLNIAAALLGLTDSVVGFLLAAAVIALICAAVFVVATRRSARIPAGIAALVLAAGAGTAMLTGAVGVYGMDARSLNYGVTVGQYGFEIHGADGPEWFHCGTDVGPIPGTDC